MRQGHSSQKWGTGREPITKNKVEPSYKNRQAAEREGPAEKKQSIYNKGTSETTLMSTSRGPVNKLWGHYTMEYCTA
jgi:hypothetical protein